jgi:2-polyprenyl-3-methyl-5-hydroxy-6-metoxy-1,4-benzoquinol methylase
MGAANNNHIRTKPCPTCYVCGSEGRQLYRGLADRLFGAPGSWDFTQCTNARCGLIWLNPMPVAEDLGKAYRTYYTHSDRPARQVSHLRRIMRNLGEGYLALKYGYRVTDAPLFYRWLGWMLYLHPGARANLDFSVFYLSAKPAGRLLEVGFGSGEMLVSMRERGWRVEGVDIDPQAVANARGKGLLVHFGTLEQQDFESGSFDAIALSHVIEHVDSPLALLQRCRALLKTGGKLVLITTNVDSLGHRLYRQHWRGLEPPRHCYVFNPRSLRLLAARAGLEAVTVWTTIRDANGMFLASERVRGAATSTHMSHSRRAYRRARLMQLFEGAMLKLNSSCGEEVVLIAGT